MFHSVVSILSPKWIKNLYSQANERDVASTHLEDSKFDFSDMHCVFIHAFFFPSTMTVNEPNKEPPFIKLNHPDRRFADSFAGTVSTQAKPVLITQLASSLNKLAASNA